MPRPSRFALAASVTVAGLLATPDTASAGEEQQPDFAFGRPRAMVGLHFSWQRARAQGDFYDLARNEFFVSMRLSMSARPA